MNNFIAHRRFESKKLIITTIVAIIAITAIIVIVIAISPREDISHYVTVSETGYNGAGSLNIQINSKKYLEDCHANNKLNDVDYLEITASIANNGTLINNNSTTITFSSADKHIRFDSMEYTVNNLLETTSVDVFENLQLEFFGANGAGTVTLNTDNCKEYIQAGISYSVHPDSELSNGDVVTVIAKEKGNTLLSSGYTIQNIQKEYTVNGLLVYPTSLENVDCGDSNTYLGDEITELVKQNGIAYPWELDTKLTSDWYLLGSFDYEYVITPVATYFSYNSDNLQKNEYCVVYKADMTATCKKTYSNIDTLKEKIKSNNLSDDTKIVGTLYFSITANSVYLDQQGKKLVLPLTDSNYNSDYYGRSYTAIEYNSSLYQIKKAITQNSDFDTVVCVIKDLS